MRLLERATSSKIFELLSESSVVSMNTDNFKDIVMRDFQLYIEDKYNPETEEELQDRLSKVTEEDVNDYFTGMFYEIVDTDDLDSANEAENIIRTAYNLLDDDYQEYDDGDTNWAAEEEADAIDRLESRYGSVNESAGRVFKVNDTVYWVGAGNEIGSTGTVIDIPAEGRMTIKWEDGDVNTYSMSHPDIQHEDDYDNWFNEDSEDDDIIYNESVKPKKKSKKEKKPEERIIMQQGNVTCLKKDNKFKVFEDKDTNIAEYDNQDEAMRDLLNRCGVNPDNELKEKNNLKEEIKTALKVLLLKKEELYNDDTITDEEYYKQIEIIDNIIANNYSPEEIEEAEKELSKED